MRFNVFVIADDGAASEILAKADQQTTSSLFNGDDAIVLRKGGSSGAIVDVIGQIGVDPGSEWTGGSIGTQNETLRRKSSVTEGDTDGSDSFDPSVQWDGFAEDTFDGLGSHTVTNTASTSTPLTPAAAGTLLAINDLGSANTISLQINQSSSVVTELLVFNTDATGGSRTQIGSFSLLQGQQFPTEYAPTLTLDSDLINNGTFQQFELVQGNSIRQAMVTVSNGQILLDFNNGVQLSATATAQTSQTNLLTNDAAAIDLTGQADVVNVRFSVYREASFNNTVGFYTTDFDNGGIRDTVTGAVLQPGDIGYQAAALARRLDVQLTGKNNQTSRVFATLPGGAFLGMFLSVDGAVNNTTATGEVYFSHAGANSGGADHVKQLGDNTFGFEDQAGLGDADYDDIVVAFEVL